MRRREPLAASLLLAACLAGAYIGRAVISSDGAEVLSDSLGLLVTGRMESASIPPKEVDPLFPPKRGLHSRYGFFPSLVPLPFLMAAWPFRSALGGAGVDAAVALTWAAGVALAAAAFLRLARRLKPDASPLWAPAFVGSTFLWPYAADSFMEPFAAAGIAFSAGSLLGPRRGLARDAFLCAIGWSAACWLKPILWVATPGFLLAVVLAARENGSGGSVPAPRAAPIAHGRFVVAAFLALGAGIAVAALVNLVRYGSFTDVGYGYTGPLPFVNPLLKGLVGLTVHPGRGILLYAPLTAVALFAFGKVSPAARAACFGIPLLHLLVVCRWYGWHGGSCWGPRYLLPMLPLLAAPAVLAPRRVAVAAVALGVLVNVPGVLVAPGAFLSYAELLTPPPAASWSKAGGDRISEVPALSPLYGHVWLLARGALPAPWLARGARETTPRPGPAEVLSPRIVRAAARYPAIPPIVPRILTHASYAYLVRGEAREAEAFAAEAVKLSPADRDAPRILEEARRVNAAPR